MTSREGESIGIRPASCVHEIPIRLISKHPQESWANAGKSPPANQALVSPTYHLARDEHNSRVYVHYTAGQCGKEGYLDPPLLITTIPTTPQCNPTPAASTVASHPTHRRPRRFKQYHHSKNFKAGLHPSPWLLFGLLIRNNVHVKSCSSVSSHFLLV
jgi:hypothetical protein